MTEADDTQNADAEAFLDEADGVGPTLSFLGHEYTLKPKIPAIVALRAQRLNKAGTDDAMVAGELMLTMVDEMFGPDMAERILTETGASIDDLGDLLMAGLRAYQGEEPAPNRAARRKRAG